MAFPTSSAVNGGDRAVKSSESEWVQSHRLDRAWGDNNQGIKRGGGVAIYWRDSLQISEHKFARLRGDVKIHWL